MSSTRIGILGIGGTGGFFGGKLAKHYQNYGDVEVIFIARNETKRNILERGLKVESLEGDFIVKPGLVSDDPAEIGNLDLLLVCVKSYGLEKAVNCYKGNLKGGGVVITIQNLVNQAERVKGLLPEDVTLLEGCAYIISNIVHPGHILHKGGPATLFFGKNSFIEEYRWVEKLLVDARIKASLSNRISEIIWEKFLFISPLGVATSYYECTIGELRKAPEKLTFLRGLMEELFQLIRIKKIEVDHKVVEAHLNFLEGLPENGKTSLQLDIENNHPAEIDSLLHYVLEEAQKHELALVNYPLASEKLTSLPGNS